MKEPRMKYRPELFYFESNLGPHPKQGMVQ
jgi:hypothetical protein